MRNSYICKKRNKVTGKFVSTCFLIPFLFCTSCISCMCQHFCFVPFKLRRLILKVLSRLLPKSDPRLFCNGNCFPLLLGIVMHPLRHHTICIAIHRLHAFAT